MVERSRRSVSLKFTMEFDSLQTQLVSIWQSRLLLNSLWQAASRFADNATPSEFLFQKIGVASLETIGRPKLHKESISFEVQFRQHKQILPQLRLLALHDFQ